MNITKFLIQQQKTVPTNIAYTYLLSYNALKKIYKFAYDILSI